MRALLSTVAFASCLGGLQNASAQDADNPSRYEIEEVVVTARKASEALQTTPVAVTALSGATLAESQVVQMSDIQKVAPAVSTSTGGPGGPGIIRVAIRGQTNNNANSASDTAVATYVDGVNIARPTSGNLSFFDVAQAEILRGPQGTLFGRNTTGGAVNLTSVQPTGERSGYANAEYGNYDWRMLEGAATLPIAGEVFSLRVAGRYASRDGYYDNPLTGRDVSDLNHSIAGRITARFAPEEAPFVLTVAADYNDWDDSGQANNIVGYNAPLFLAFGLPAPTDFLVGPGGAGRFDETYGVSTTGLAEIDTPNDDGQSAGVAATLDITVSDWSIKSISAWRKADSNNSLDLDGTPLALISYASGFRQDQYSEELQVSRVFGKLDFIAGAFYFREEGIEQGQTRALGFLGRPIAREHADFESTSKALYTQANYNLTEQLRVTGGLRYTWDRRFIERHGVANIAFPTACSPPIPLTPRGCALPFTAKFDYPAWTIGVDYKISDNLFVYAKSSNASMAGGFNTRPTPAGQESFQPEETTDFEIGAKIDAFDRRLRANVAAFALETKDAQRNITGVIGGRLTQYVQNAGDVKASGIELEMTALPWQGMELKIGGSYLDAKYKKGTFIEDRGLPGAPLLVDRSAEPIPQAPEWTFSFGATQDFDLDIGTLTIHADYAYIDDKVISVGTATPGAPAAVIAAQQTANDLARLKAYSLINGRIALTLEGGVELSVFGRNLTDEKYYTYAFDALSTLGFVTQYQGTPRTYGVALRYNF